MTVNVIASCWHTLVSVRLASSYTAMIGRPRTLPQIRRCYIYFYFTSPPLTRCLFQLYKGEWWIDWHHFCRRDRHWVLFMLRWLLIFRLFCMYIYRHAYYISLAILLWENQPEALTSFINFMSERERESSTRLDHAAPNGFQLIERIEWLFMYIHQIWKSNTYRTTIWRGMFILNLPARHETNRSSTW